MSFSTTPLTKVLAWCEKNKCSGFEISNSENELVEILIDLEKFEIILQIKPANLLSSIKIIKDKTETIFEETQIDLQDCLNILEKQIPNV